MLFIALLLSLVGYSQALNEAYAYSGTGCTGTNASLAANATCLPLYQPYPGVFLYGTLVCNQGAVHLTLSGAADCGNPSIADGNSSECLSVTLAGVSIYTRVFCDVSTGDNSSTSSTSSSTSSSSGVSGSSSDVSASSAASSSGVASSSAVVSSSSTVLPPLTPGNDVHAYLWLFTCPGGTAVVNYTANNDQCLPIIDIVSSSFVKSLPSSFASSSIALHCDSKYNNFTAHFYSLQNCTLLNTTITGSLSACTPLDLEPGVPIDFQVTCLVGSGTNGVGNLTPQLSLIGLLIFALALKYSN